MTPPVFAHGSLRLYLLALLDEQPRHGYELIQALSDRFGGTYSPSAGTIYPRLSKLEEEGLVTKSTDGRKTVYEITDAGRAELDARRHELDAIEDDAHRLRAAPRRRRARRGERRHALAPRRTRERRARGQARRRPARRRARRARTVGRRPPASPSSRTAPCTRPTSCSTEFRQQLRTDLRTHAHRGLVSPESVSLLKARLAQVRADVLATLAANG